MKLRLIVMFTNVEYRERESRRQTSEGEREKGQEENACTADYFYCQNPTYILEFFINSSPPTSNSVYQQNFMGKTLKIVMNNNNNCASAGVNLAPGLPSVLVYMGNGRYIDFYLELFKKVTE